MDLIFVSMENWDEIWRRNQFICAELARRFPNDKILFVGLARDVSNQLRRFRWRGLMDDETHVIPSYPQITFTRSLKFLPNSLAIGRAVNQANARKHVRRVAARLNLSSPVLWLNPHSAAHMAGRMGESAVIYDITDDWISLTQTEANRRLTEEQDHALCRSADSVIVCSQRLYDLKKSLAQNLHLIPNGVDADHYRSVQDRSLSLPPGCERWEKPVLGYTGTIHPDRVDTELIEAMCRKMEWGCIALVGPCHLPDPLRRRLESGGRVHFTGQVPYSAIPDYMRAFDVCITPHRVTDFTESLNPIKLWEYLAGGKPIVSTPVAGFRDFPQHVRLAIGYEAFLAEANAALNEEPAACEARMAEAANHSWGSRVDAILQVVEAALKNRRRV